MNTRPIPHWCTTGERLVKEWGYGTHSFTNESPQVNQWVGRGSLWGLVLVVG